MAGVNRVTLLGHLGKDPELKEFNNGGKVANVSLATSERWKGKDGQMQEHTEWHNLVFNDRLAEIADQYLSKGSKIYVEGKIKTRPYDKDGEKRYITEIRVNEMQMLDGKPQDGGQRSESRSNDARRESAARAPAATNGGMGFDGPDDDIPF